VGLLALLGGELTANDVLADVVFLGEVEELADLGGSLGAKTSGDVVVCEAWEFGISLLHDDKVDDGEVRADDASADGLSLSLTVTALAVASSSLAEEKSDSGVGQNSLLHGESLLVVSTGDLEDVALVLLSKRVSLDLLGHTLVIEGADLDLIVDLNGLLCPGWGVGYVQLHHA